MDSSDAAELKGAERRTSPVELFWDLAFVYAITQVTHFLLTHLTWGGFFHAMLILALVWWAWSAFVWAANAQEEDSGTMQLALLTSLVLIFIAEVAIPGAFGGAGAPFESGNTALLFALTYSGVRLIHLWLYVDASRRGNASWEAIAGFGVATLSALALLVIGAIVGGGAQVVLWALAVALDYAGPAWLTRERLRGLQQVAVAHFAERYGLFVIICLGESIVAIGLAANPAAVEARLVAAVGFGLLTTIGLWRTYFGELAVDAARRLRNHRGDVVLAAADAYSYLHLLIVSGIVIFAVGAQAVVGFPGALLPAEVRLCLCGGVALYLVGHAAFRLRLIGEVNTFELGAVAATALVYLLPERSSGWEVHGWVTMGLLAAIVLLLCWGEATAARNQRRPG
jgi:low temperature requirement protein LtrA